MKPRLASLLTVLLLALSLVPAGAMEAESPAVCPAAQAAAEVALPAELGLEPQPKAPTCRPDECAAFCAPLIGKCRSGSCVCFRDPL
jgi:hypothetical protein